MTPVSIIFTSAVEVRTSSGTVHTDTPLLSSVRLISPRSCDLVVQGPHRDHYSEVLLHVLLFRLVHFLSYVFGEYRYCFRPISPSHLVFASSEDCRPLTVGCHDPCVNLTTLSLFQKVTPFFNIVIYCTFFTSRIEDRDFIKVSRFIL